MKKIAALLALSSILACQSEKKGGQAADSTNTEVTAITDTLTFKYDSLKVYSKLALPASSKDTTKATIVYPVFSSNKINSFIQAAALKTDSPDDPEYKNYSELAAGFIKGFDDYKKDNKDDQQTWFKEVRIKVQQQRKGYLGLRYDFIDYAGGAHPNYAIVFHNYSTISDKSVTIDSLIKPGSLPALTATAEKIFRKNEKLTPKQSLADHYFFEKNTFSLPRNFTITDQGLKFLYNPYEIKPYAAGTTELLVPFEQIKEILKPNPVLPALK
ncbi:DUF3298 and DUF4163 domain-containing protein [Pedobacter sp.]|uniref:DUF3298 and DUF4163 domain-containing protein n=1 Tax=Pedobacter sp. TaxID=1411316 RepID=UPI002CF90BEF|nr:DUF3298 domain-containing protein [Pedobacter sp.]HWW38230.1 DUF3298 domain-containing protein [Pedobacter sp.]